MKLLENRGQWYKGNLHLHTTMSDGALTPEEVIDRYRNAGYSFIALTDHRQENPAWEDRDFVVLTGAEYDTGDPASSMPLYHILGIGMEQIPRIRYRESYEARHPWPTAQEIINAIRDAGGLAILAHPAWSVMDPEEMLQLHGFSAAEIYNTNCGIPIYPDRADSSRYFDIWAKNGKLVRAVAADDAHDYEGEECTSYIMVNAAHLSERAIMEALRNGDYYASQGPEIYDIELEDEQIVVEFSDDVETVLFLTNSPWGRNNIQFFEPAGRSIFEPRIRVNGGRGRRTARYIADRSEKFIRIELIGRDGARAWSSPYSLREF